MPEKKQANNNDKKYKQLCVNDLRHAEYYQLQQTFDELYAQSKAGKKFTDLMSIILSRENILLAYRNIKTNKGSKTVGTDKVTIQDIGKMSCEDIVYKVRYLLTGNRNKHFWEYRPKAVRRKEIPKPNGKMRPLGIPCMWDRLIQQCIKQIMEPICEAKFSNNSYGFRPCRSAENAIAETYRLMQLSKLSFVIEFDIESFFDNVNHIKLIRQIWAIGIQDKHLVYILKQILKAPIQMPDGTIVKPQKGTPQGGIISPLLANVVLNELDHWIDSQWQNNPVCEKYKKGSSKSGTLIKSNAYAAMRKTNLKEMYIIRYADDFRIFCRTLSQARKIKIAVTEWLLQRLKLNVSQEKTRIVNCKKKYSEFLGFKLKLRKRSKKFVIKSHMGDKASKQIKHKLGFQAKKMVTPAKLKTERDEIMLYNSMVIGIQNYYSIATEISKDCSKINRLIITILTNRLGDRLRKKGRELTVAERNRYGKSKMLRFIAGSEEPIYPISYVQFKKPMSKKKAVNIYMPEERKYLHNNLQINISLMEDLMRQSSGDRSAEFMDNRISLFAAQFGRCAITGIEFETIDDIHCHHKKPKKFGGSDKYVNLILVMESVHKLIHAVNEDIIDRYLKILNLNRQQLNKLNRFRELVGNEAI